MSEKESKDESWTNALLSIRKANPIAFILAFVLMNLFGYVYHSDMAFIFKVFGLIICGVFFLGLVLFESYRIETEREARKKALW